MASALSPLSRRFLLPCLLAILACVSSAFAAPPAAPTAMATTYTNVDGGTQLWRFNWTDNSTDEDGFRIYYRIGGGNGPSAILQEISVPPSIKTATGPLTISRGIPSNAWSQPVSAVEFYVMAYKTTGEVSASTDATLYNPWPGPPQSLSLVAPSGLALSLVNDGSLRITFADNSNCEEYFELNYKKSSDSTWMVGRLDFNTSSSDIGGYQTALGFGPDGVQDPPDDPTPDDQLIFLPNFQTSTPYDFRVRAVGFDLDGSGTNYTAPVSAFTNIVSTSTQAFKAPTGLLVTRAGENSFTWSFQNNSTADSGTELQYRVVGATDWQTLGKVDDPFFTTIPNTKIPPGHNYEFRVRAYIRTSTNPTVEPTIFSAFSNVATGTALFTAPTNLTATSPSEGLVNLAWTDNSSAEGNYEVQVRVKGTVEWSFWAYLSANTTSLTNQLISPGDILEFRVRATSGVQAEHVSNFTNIAEVTTTFKAPTSFIPTASLTDPCRISFAWTDNSAVESDYELQYRKLGDTNYATRKLIPNNGGAAPNSMSIADLPEFDPGSNYEFRIRAVLAASNGTVIAGSAFSNVMNVTTLNGFSSKPYAPITMGVPFSYQLATLSQQQRTSWSVGTLPAGLTFDSSSGIISGTPTVSGLFSVPLTANFSGGTSHVMNLALRVLRPSGAPQIASVIADQVVAPGSTTTVSLTSKFADPDTDAAIRMSTNKGDLDIVLYTSLTPGTVANFLNYNYVNTIFHRSPAGFVLQGGGYTSYAAPDIFESITRQAEINNEPGISNTYGTIAMAKVGDDPDSATSEFFFSLGNNSLNLDNQNGGFTVFGRLSAPSTNVMSTLNAIPTKNYAVKLRQNGTTPDSANFTFTDIPIEGAPTTIDQTKLLKIVSMTNLPILTYSITTAPDAGIATATLVGSDLKITSTGPGSTSLVITATDVDANIAQQTVYISTAKTPATVTINSSTLSQTYNGSPREVTATTVPPGLNVGFVYQTTGNVGPTNAGSYNVVATINDATYGGSSTGTLVVSKAAASLTLGGLDRTYDGTAKSATAVTTPTGLSVAFTYNDSALSPTAHGSYTVVGTITDPNYTATPQTGTLVIHGQAAADWRTQNFTPQQISAGQAADNADPDGDGVTNLAEYALGTNPKSSTPGPAAPVKDANGLSMTFTRPKGLPGIVYAAQSSDDLITWHPLTLELIADGPVQTMRAIDPLTSGNLSRRFIRLLFQVAP